MRASATIMGILSLLLVSCSVLPDPKLDAKGELSKLKGANVDTIESVQRSQAEKAVAVGDFKRAASAYKQLTDKYPNNDTYQLALADNLRRAGDDKDALGIMDALLKKEPNNAGALEIKGLTLMSTGEFPEAGQALGQAMKSDPKRWRTLNGIGILFAMKGKYDGAMAYFQEALNVSTDNPSILNNAALTYAINHQFPRAYESFERAKRHMDAESKDLKRIDLNLALVYAVDGKLDEAQAVAAPHLSKEGLYNNMGFYAYLSKNNEMAKSYLNMALTQSPTYYERAWKNLGALTGDQNASANVAPQPMPAGAQYSSDMSAAAPSAQAPQPAAIPLSDIPESKPLHSDAAAPFAGEEKKEQAVAKPDEKPVAKPADKPAAKAADKKAKVAEKKKPVPAKPKLKKPAPAVTPDEATPAGDGDTKAAPALTPPAESSSAPADVPAAAPPDRQVPPSPVTQEGSRLELPLPPADAPVPAVAPDATAPAPDTKN